MKEVISIVVPVYNAEQYIGRMIKSIMKQTYTSWQLVIVNDGSTDRSGKVIDKYAKQDERIFAIHQKNKGSIEARKTGVLSEWAQRNPYIMVCDADDELPENSLERLYKEIKSNNADMVCGNMKHMWKTVKIAPRFVAPCFQIESPRIYNHEQIIEELFMSYFGVSNFPVSLWGKIYKTEVLTEAINQEEIVRFFGEDLSVTIRIVPVIEKLVIIPDDVYYYRIGGGTSRFSPYMMEDFLKLYRYKKQFIIQYPMPQDAGYYMNVELLNITKTHFMQCIRSKQFNNDELYKEIVKVCKTQEVQMASLQLLNLEKGISPYAGNIYNCDVEAIVKEMEIAIKKNRWKDYIKSILKKI